MAITNNGSAQTAAGSGTGTDLTRFSFVAAGGENSKSGTDRNGLTLNYTIGKEEVFLNGVLLVRGLDYTTPDAGTIASLSILSTGDYLEIVAYTSSVTNGNVTLSTFTTKGDLIAGTTNANIGKIAAGTDGLFLTTDSTQTTGLKWAAVDTGSVETTIFMGAY
jgi:hypothetical protein